MTQFERVLSNDFEPVIMSRHRRSMFPLRRMCIRKGRLARGDKLPSMVFRAVELGHEQVMEILLARGAIGVEPQDEDGQTLSSKAAKAAKAGDVAILKQLLTSEKADVESKDNDGRTCLSWTTGSGHLDATRLLTEHGVNIESKDTSDRSRGAAQKRREVG